MVRTDIRIQGHHAKIPLHARLYSSGSESVDLVRRLSYPGEDLVREKVADTLIIISGATGIPGVKYEALAQFLTSQGHGLCSTMVWDYSMCGKSLPIGDTHTLTHDRALSNSITMSAWVRDMECVLAWAQEQAYRHVVHIGHSVGGHLLPLCCNASVVTRAVNMAVQSAYYGFSPSRCRGVRTTTDTSLRSAYKSSTRDTMYILWKFVVPLACTYYGYFPGTLLGLGSSILPAGVMRDWARWSLTPDYLMDRRYYPKNFERYEKFDKDVLAVFASDDEFIRVGNRRLASYLETFDSVCVRVPADVAPPEIVDMCKHMGSFRRVVFCALGAAQNGCAIGHNGWREVSHPASKHVWPMLLDFCLYAKAPSETSKL